MKWFNRKRRIASLVVPVCWLLQGLLSPTADAQTSALNRTPMTREECIDQYRQLTAEAKAAGDRATELANALTWPPFSNPQIKVLYARSSQLHDLASKTLSSCLERVRGRGVQRTPLDTLADGTDVLARLGLERTAPEIRKYITGRLQEVQARSKETRASFQRLADQIRSVGLSSPSSDPGSLRISGGGPSTTPTSSLPSKEIPQRYLPNEEVKSSEPHPKQSSASSRTTAQSEKAHDTETTPRDCIDWGTDEAVPIIKTFHNKCSKPVRVKIYYLMNRKTEFIVLAAGTKGRHEPPYRWQGNSIFAYAGVPWYSVCSISSEADCN